MEVTDIASLAQSLIEDYQSLLLIDPYIKIKIEISDSVKISDCIEMDEPAAWLLRLNATAHADHIDVQISVISGLLNVLLSDIPHSKKRGEIISKLTHIIAQFTPINGDEGADEAEEAADPGFNVEV